MDVSLAMGVGRWAERTGRFDPWVPVLVLVAFVLVRVVARLGITWRTTTAAVAGGTLWAWALDWIGPIAASSLAFLVAVVPGEVVHRSDSMRRRRAA
jgi:uncharacterized membrane protein YdjX (TVP38/TMEM64 family)